MKSTLYYIFICLLLIFTGFVASQIMLTTGWEDKSVSPIDFAGTLSVLANLSTVVGLGLAIYVYKNWKRQQLVINNEKALLQLYAAFTDFFADILPYVAATRGKFNLSLTTYSHEHESVWTPQKASLLTKFEKEETEYKKLFTASLKSYAKQYDLFCISTRIDKIDSVEPESLFQLVESFHELVDEVILLGNYSEKSHLIEKRQQEIRSINDNFLKSYSTLKQKLETLS